MQRRILFVIRSKLGDTLISYSCVRAFVNVYPHDDVTLLTRKPYAALISKEAGITVVGFDSRVDMLFKLLWMRMTSEAFDVLGVLFGSGPPIRRIGQLVKAKRKIAWNKRFAPELFEEGAMPPDHLLVDPAVSVIRVFEPNFKPPGSLRIPSLIARRAAARQSAIGIVPIADERRRNLDAAALTQLIQGVRQRHPASTLRVFVNPVNAGAEAVVAQRFPSGVELCTFKDLSDLVEQYMELAAWYGTDTGLYHLAVACGIPATVFFGPTQPHKIVMPKQSNVKVYRLSVLGNAHCDEKSCARPLCLHMNVAAFANSSPLTRIDETPSGCPLRAYPSEALTAISDHSPIAA